VNKTKQFINDRNNLINETASSFKSKLEAFIEELGGKKEQIVAFNIAYRMLIDRLRKDNPDADKVEKWED
jgi:hypothetical protein